ncbi:hypothetical protein BD410DRAFT_787087 [Rickenella mellea]|uniref:Uncharacterized protein n=1 Tax=Rickenella mellea TaxID=50990 RepID=A0A4Y7Q823_9AGAM|nr:hypothetical protein BD410DRAFT_787087 [Rickenella mellea]
MALANYSSLFTSGLLSESHTPTGLKAFPQWPRPSKIADQRRGSLPVSVNSSTSMSFRNSTNSMASGYSYYVVMQRRRTSKQLRSFLSLDLAETQSTRSGSTRRRATSPPPLKHKGSFVSISDFPMGQSFADFPLPSPIAEERQSSTTLHRASRESMRSVPSPKPIPSSSLPPLPTPKAAPQPLRVQTPADFPSHRHSDSFASVASTAVSSGYRRKRRGDALARLEGRSRPPVQVSQPGNFMSMSDDEDDMDMDEEEEDVINDEDTQHAENETEAADEELPTPDSESVVDPWIATLHASFNFGTARRDNFYEKPTKTKTSNSLSMTHSDALGLQLIDPSHPHSHPLMLNDAANFIDLFDDRDSISSSWSSLFDVACTA